MSARTILGGNGRPGVALSDKRLKAVTPPIVEDWVRNPSWLPMPTVLDTDQTVVILKAVFPTSDYVQINCSNAYTVDWGDGVVENTSAGTGTLHLYDYNAVSLDDTNAPVTITEADNRINRTAHGVSENQVVNLYDVTGAAGVVEAASYYAVNVLTDSFQLSRTLGGAPVEITTDGAAALLPYKQAFIFITPQAGQNLITVNLTQRPSLFTSNDQATGYLDLVASLPNANAQGLLIGADPAAAGMNVLERVRYLNMGGQTGISFRNCTALQVIELPPSTAMGNLVNAFRGCTALEKITLPAFPNVTNCSNAFDGASSLVEVAFEDLSSLQTASSMFTGCVSLVYGPELDTELVATAGSMFSSCFSLRRTPAYRMPNNTSAASMFAGCAALEEAPDILLGAASAQSMFSGCTSLRAVELSGLANITNATSMFQACSALEQVVINNIGASNMSSMFSTCSALKSVVLRNAPNVTNAGGMFGTCYSLTDIQFEGFSAGVTSISGMFSTCRSLIEFPDMDLSACTDISTAFLNCSSMIRAPDYDFSAVTNASSAFSGCVSLMEVPDYDMPLCTGLNSTFAGCARLVRIPSFNLPDSNVSNMFANCRMLEETPPIVSTGASSSSVVSGCTNLRKCNVTGLRTAQTFAGSRMNKTEIEAFLQTLGRPTTAVALTFTDCAAVRENPTLSRTLVTTARARTAVCTNTAGLAVGMIAASGSSMSNITNTSVTSNVATDRLNFTGHGYLDGDSITVNARGTTTGVNLNTRYYVVNATANDFQLAETPGGAPIDLTGTNATLTIRALPYIVSIDPNVSVTLSAPAISSVSQAINFTSIDLGEAYMRNFTVTL